MINGRQAVLVKLYINASDTLTGPHVEYIEMHGKDIRTGESLSEKLFRSSPFGCSGS